MFFFGLAFSTSTKPNIQTLNTLASERNVERLSQYLDAASKPFMPFSCIKTGGCYGVGLDKPWHFSQTAFPIGSGQKFIVFSTPLTSEDIGCLLFKVAGNKLHYIPEDQNFGARIVRNDILAQFRLAAHSATFVSNSPIKRIKAGLTTVRVGPEFKFTSIRANGHNLSFAQSEGIAFFNLPAGKTKVTFQYEGIIDAPYYAGSISTDHVLLSDDYWYPMIARNPAPYSIAAQIPSNWIAIGQGNMEWKKEGKSTSEWKFRMPVPVSIYSFSAGPYKEASIQVNKIKYHVWSAKEPMSALKNEVQFYPSIIEYYSKVFSPFPFNTYGAVIEPFLGNSALEAYSYATYPSLPGLDPHEPSHTWWGGIIPNTYLHSLWNESFADFSVVNYNQHCGIGSNSDREMAFIDSPSVSFSNGEIPDGTTVPVVSGGAFRGPIASYLGYSKGAYILLQLEDEMGYKSMMACCRLWLANHDPKTAGEWSGFEQAVRQHEGKKWDWFFHQWLDQAGIPEFQFTNVQLNQGKLQFQVHFQSRLYRMKVHYLVSTPHSTFPSTFEIRGEKQTENYSLSVPTDAQSVSFDPYRQLIMKVTDTDPRVTISSLRETKPKFAFGSVSKDFGRATAIQSMPDSLGNKVIIFGKDQWANPDVISLFKSAGMTLNEGRMTFRGTTVSLSDGCAEAILQTSSGPCLIIIGEPKFSPETGKADRALTDGLGRFLCGTVSPIQSGPLYFKLDSNASFN